MPTNTQTIAAIVGGTVPPDLLCIRNGQDVVDLVAAICSVAVNVAQIPGGGDSVAQLALETANIALATAQAAQAAIPQARISTSVQSLPTGDAAVPIVWTPALPDTNYEILVNYKGTSVFPAAYFNWYVQADSMTTEGCTLRFNNTPANFGFTFSVKQMVANAPTS